MQLEYDLDVGALYIRLGDSEVARTREAGDNAAVDLDAADRVVGVEVISIGHPWPLADILASYDIPASEEAQIRAYFHPHQGWAVQQERPEVSVTSPAPAMVAA